jgi:hypothetical protein
MRSVPKKVFSGLKIGAVLVAVVALSLAFLSFIPVRRIEAYYWHLRHGNSVEVGGYRFPVPNQWYVNSLSANDVMLIDLNTGDSITVQVRSAVGRSTLAAWEALIAHPVPGGSEKVLRQKELQASAEPMVCVEKSMNAKGIILYPIYCRSESALDVTFAPQISSAKHDDQTFYSLLQQLRRP